MLMGYAFIFINSYKKISKNTIGVINTQSLYYSSSSQYIYIQEEESFKGRVSDPIQVRSTVFDEAMRFNIQ